MKKIIILCLILMGCSNNGDDYTNITYLPPELEDNPCDDTDEPEVPRDVDAEPYCHTKLIGFKDGLTVQDEQALNSAKQRCQVHFPDAPCLKKFIKKGDQVYHAVCGKYHKSHEDQENESDN